jgi:hypothetical protein
MEKEIWIARNKGGQRLFAFGVKPAPKGNGWDSRGKGWIELKSSWCENITYDNSPARLRGVVLARGF